MSVSSNDECSDYQYTFPAPASCINKGTCILINDEPCSVIKYTMSKAGKSSPTMINIAAVDIFEDTYVEHSVPKDQTIDFVNDRRTSNKLIKLDEKGNASIWRQHHGLKKILMDPETDFFKKVMTAYKNKNPITVELIRAMGKERVVTKIHESKH